MTNLGRVLTDEETDSFMDICEVNVFDIFYNRLKIKSNEDFISLKDIREYFKTYDFLIVINETPLNGFVYKMGNYPETKNKWQLTGILYGYA